MKLNRKTNQENAKLHGLTGRLITMLSTTSEKSF